MTHDRSAGFTLIEALVAMAVLALGAVALLSAAEGHTKRINGVTDRVAARWAAEYQLSLLRLGLAAPSGDLEFMNRRFEVETTRHATDDPDLVKVSLKVAKSDSSGTIYLLDAYLDNGGTH